MSATPIWRAAARGAGHAHGRRRRRRSRRRHARRAAPTARRSDLAALETMPPASLGRALAGWSIPVVIVLSLLAIGLRQGPAAVGDNAALLGRSPPGLPGLVGAVARARRIRSPLLATFLAAPVTTLSPLIGVGYVAALVQAYVRPPLVREIQTRRRRRARPAALVAEPLAAHLSRLPAHHHRHRVGHAGRYGRDPAAAVLTVRASRRASALRGGAARHRRPRRRRRSLGDRAIPGRDR